MEFNTESEFKSDLPAPQVIATQRSAREEFEVKSSVGSLGATFGVLMASILLGVIAVSIYFFIRSFWLVIHPKFEFSIPKLPSLTLLSTGQAGDAPKNNPDAPAGQLSNLPPKSQDFSQQQVEEFLDRLKSSGSQLTNTLTSKELLDLGSQVCKGFDDGFTNDEVNSGFGKSVSSNFPSLTGVQDLVDGVMKSATDNLCPRFKQSQ